VTIEVVPIADLMLLYLANYHPLPTLLSVICPEFEITEYSLLCSWNEGLNEITSFFFEAKLFCIMFYSQYARKRQRQPMMLWLFPFRLEPQYRLW